MPERAGYERTVFVSMDTTKKIHDILGPHGLLARSMEGYEHRDQQVRMAIEAFEALISEDRLVIEAPTGTGKTLAYLVAAALSRKRVAISTGTKNLQEQLFYKDIPFVRATIFPKLRAALLKGRGNFICHARFRAYLRQPFIQGLVGDGSLQAIKEWYRATRTSGQGDRAELIDLPDDDPVWAEICSTSEGCLGKKCPDKDDCFVLKMRARAAESDLMIVNHHLLVSDLVVKESGFAEVIPRYEALIIDEAHGLEDAATQHFGFHLSHFRVSRLVRDAKMELAESANGGETLQDLLSTVEDLSRRLFFGKLQGVNTPEQVSAWLDPDLAELRDQLSGRLDIFAAKLANLPHLSEELRTVARRALEIQTELNVILDEEPNGEYACWMERKDRNVMLHASPVEVGRMFQTKLYEQVPSIIFTSATLSSGKLRIFQIPARPGLGATADRDHAGLAVRFRPPDHTLHTPIHSRAYRSPFRGRHGGHTRRPTHQDARPRVHSVHLVPKHGAGARQAGEQIAFSRTRSGFSPQECPARRIQGTARRGSFCDIILLGRG